jgi:hypothetical protein
MYAVVSTQWGYKIGHSSLDIIGMYSTWMEAMRAGLKSARIETPCDEELTTITEDDLTSLLPRDGCIWAFSENGDVMFWTGCDDGSYGILVQEVTIPVRRSSRKRMKPNA